MAYPVSEIFSSVQGEGPLLGCRQIFIRVHGCNIDCAYCDTLSGETPAYCRVETEPGGNDFKQLPNPLRTEDIALATMALGLYWHDSVSLTGGEPLLYPGLIKELVPLLKGTRRGIYLETNGTLPDNLAQVIDLIDTVAMDFKLPSVTGESEFWDQHRRFLHIAKIKRTFVKVVVGGNTTFTEIDIAAEMIKNNSPGVILIIQPVSENANIKPVTPNYALQLQQRALRILDDVRIIPQMHKVMGFL